MLRLDPGDLKALLEQLNEFNERFRGVFDLDQSISVDELGSLFAPWFDTQPERWATEGQEVPHATVVQEVHQQIAEIYKVDNAFVSTGGTTVANKLALFTLLTEGERVLVERDCHISVIQAINEIGADPIWLTPIYDEKLGINRALTEDQVRQALGNPENDGIRAAVFTSPKYYGVCGPIAACVRMCHAKRIPVLVDEAHGDCLPFHPSLLPTSATSSEVAADIVTNSTHKATQALAQGSILLINGRRLQHTDKLRERFLHALQNTPAVSTSFSFPILLSVQAALIQLALGGEGALSRAIDRANRLRAAIKEIDGLTTWDANDLKLPQPGFLQLNPLRVTVDVSGIGLTGFEAVELMQSDEHCTRVGLEPFVAELADLKNVLILVRIGTSDADIKLIAAHFQHLAAKKQRKREIRTPVLELPRKVMLPRAAFWAVARGQAEWTPVKQARGKVAGQTIGVYPPGNTIIVHGERLEQDILDYLQTLAEHHAHFKGTSKRNFAGKAPTEFTHILTITHPEGT